MTNTYNTIKYTKEQQRANAVANLEKLHCYKPYLNEFKKNGIVTLYEGFGGYYLDPKYGSQETELMDKIKELEIDYNGTVYAVIHNRVDGRDLYSMLWTSGEVDAMDGYYDAGEVWASRYGGSWVYAYTWDKDGWDTEFGEICVEEKFGGLIRTA